MKYLKPKILPLILATTCAVGACGPMASSASKFGIGGGSDSLKRNVSADTSSDDEEVPTQETEVILLDAFKAGWEETSKTKPSMIFADTQLAAIKASLERNAPAVLVANDPRVDGAEGTLSGPRSHIRIYAVLRQNARIKELRRVKMLLDWIPSIDEGHHETGRWELSLVTPDQGSTDPATATAAQLLSKGLLEELSAIAIEFNVDASND